MHIWSPSTSCRIETIGILQAGTSPTGTDAYPIWNNASANAKPTEYDYMSSDGGTDSITQFDYEAIIVNVHSGSALADYCIDIGIENGSVTGIPVWPLVSDLRLPNRKTIADRGISVYIPVHVPRGSSLRQRAAASTGSATGQITITGLSCGIGGAPGYSRCIGLFTPGTSRGVAIDPGGTAGTKGSWAQMIASTPHDIKAMFGIIGHNNDVARAAAARMHIDIGVGSSGNEYVLYPDFTLAWAPTSDTPDPCVWPCFPCDIPAGTRIAARAECSDNTAGDRTVDLALYGLVA